MVGKICQSCNSEEVIDKCTMGSIQCSADKKVKFNGKYFTFLPKHLTQLPNFVCLMVILQAHSLVKLLSYKRSSIICPPQDNLVLFFGKTWGETYCRSSWCSSCRKSCLVMLRPSKWWLLGYCTVCRG